MRPPKPVVGLLGYCLLACDLDNADTNDVLHWWRTSGGFARVPRPYPLLFSSRRKALDFICQLQRREYPVLAFPARLALPNAR